MKQILAAALLAVSAAACHDEVPKPDDRVGAIARDYVLLSLEIGEKEEGYIDAYYGPPDLQARAKAQAPSLTLPELAKRVEALQARVAAVPSQGDSLDARRVRFLTAQLTAAATRLRMMQGEKLTFAEEARGLFGVAPELKPLPTYDPVLAKIETMLPGNGTLADRVDSFQNRFNIPTERLKPTFDAAIAECKRRTTQHIALPKNESFELEFVTGKSWGGYNYYKGNAHSLIQVNTDLPIRISRAVDLGCHEGYPGHHVLNALLEERLTKGRGWVEFSVYPLYSPQSLIAEGSANYGIDLAFPGDEQLAFETATLYPLAGLPTADAAKYLTLSKAMRDLAGARFTIARDYLEGRITRAEAVKLEPEISAGIKGAGREEPRLHRPVSHLRHQLRPRPGHGPRLCRGGWSRPRGEVGADGEDPVRADAAERPEALKLPRQLRHDLEQVADQADVGDLEDRGFLVLVDGDDRLGILHAGEVLDRSGNADRDIDVRRDDLAGLADLIIVGRIAGIDRSSRGSDRRSELVGERVEQAVELVVGAEGAAAGDDDLGAGQFRPLRL